MALALAVNVYPLESYKIGQKEERPDKDATIAARFARMCVCVCVCVCVYVCVLYRACVARACAPTASCSGAARYARVSPGAQIRKRTQQSLCKVYDHLT